MVKSNDTYSFEKFENSNLEMTRRSLEIPRSNQMLAQNNSGGFLQINNNSYEDNN